MEIVTEDIGLAAFINGQTVQYQGQEEKKMLCSLFSTISEETCFPENYEWNYRDPSKLYELSKRIDFSKTIEKTLLQKDPIDAHYVHKKHEENVMISEAVKVGAAWYFQGLSKMAELNSDHISDHIDGIKLFEIFRQATLASFHLNGLHFEGVVALTQSDIEYFKYIEPDEPFYIQAIPICKPDGGAMYCVFEAIQSNTLVASGYLTAYTYRSKEIYQEKRGLKK
jgi:hypothetical protein